MKTLVTILSLSLFSSVVCAQDLKGQWNGVLNVQNNQLKLVFNVVKNDTLYKTTMDSPDQQAKDIPVKFTTFKYPLVKFELLDIGAVYEGTMIDDRITGKWMQSGQTFPLVLEKVIKKP